MRWFLAILFVVLLVLAGGCLADPRIMECDQCGKVFGVRGGLLPGQFSQCSCGGSNRVVKHLTRHEWQDAADDGGVHIE